MKALVVFTSLFISLTANASTLSIAQSILGNKELMSRVESMALKNAKADAFLGIEVVANKTQFQATITYTPSKPTWTSEFRYSVMVTGKTDGIKAVSAEKFNGDGE